jgi:hypothetical protein
MRPQKHRVTSGLDARYLEKGVYSPDKKVEAATTAAQYTDDARGHQGRCYEPKAMEGEENRRSRPFDISK